ncbi:natural resistance-associated macrophage protein-domain-containing protein [Podospora australis]|uniref:Natural resistance-associated macrophage protein-domain-containing protein n=1 Tax=Podospora australis TaxID=1536484 RepID=A0AAN6WYT0_9PEZI|nr:natural resistance-associated macrophage protein-domain-containing protein [Podospora australis]
MNRPSRTDEPQVGDSYNQSPPHLANDLTTNQDLTGIANSRTLRRELPNSMPNPTDSDERPILRNRSDDIVVDDDPDREIEANEGDDKIVTQQRDSLAEANQTTKGRDTSSAATTSTPSSEPVSQAENAANTSAVAGGDGHDHPPSHSTKTRLQQVKHAITTFGKFVGPGFMVAVAYIDPGNYATDVAAGASYQFRLLFIVLLSNGFAIFLQSLSIKLGTVSGLNLAEACRAFLPRWLNYVLYALAESAIIATDIAENQVIGTAIAINLLIPQIPLVAGCALSIVEVMFILIFYRPNGSMNGLRAFEIFVMLLVLAVVVCFCIQLSLIQDTSAGKVLQGYLPSQYLVEQTALYQACGILGATVMPHSLYLGSGIVQARLYDYDNQKGLLPPTPPGSPSPSIRNSRSTYSSSVMDGKAYIPSLAAIRHSLKYSIAEVSISLFTFALFVNSAILIVAGASLYGKSEADDADLFGIHRLLSESIAPAAGTVFALALLFSGISAGIVCTIAGQMVSEGALRWSLKPWLRRLVTRSISIIPSIIIAAAVGRDGLNAALNGSQVALSIALPFITAPLIYFTSLDKFMMVRPGTARYGGHYGTEDEESVDVEAENDHVAQRGWMGQVRKLLKVKDCYADRNAVKMANNWLTASFGILVWLIITVMNIANLVLLGQGS